jgi:molybdate transport system ATP-binding protein
MNEPVLAIDRLRILDTIVSAEIGAGELVAVIGPNRSGKTTLAEILRGSVRDVAGTVRRTVDIRDIAYSAYSADGNLFHYADFYYQQRYNTFDDAAVDTVGQYLRYDEADGYRRDLFAAVLPPSILQTKLIELSSGETRKTLLLKNLFREAKVYILDNPLSGLDEASGAVFLDVFGRIARRYRKTVILLLADPPAGVAFDRVIRLNRPEKRKAEADVRPVLPPAFLTTPPADFEIVLALEKETLTIGKRILIRDLSWRIRRGEKWLLEGANGSGKSTLLSLLTADNPFAYRYDFFTLRPEAGNGRVHLGHQSAHRLHFRRHATVRQRLVLHPGRHPFGFFRHDGAEPAHHRRGSGPLPGDCRGSGSGGPAKRTLRQTFLG